MVVPDLSTEEGIVQFREIYGIPGDVGVRLVDDDSPSAAGLVALNSIMICEAGLRFPISTYLGKMLVNLGITLDSCVPNLIRLLVALDAIYRRTGVEIGAKELVRQYSIRAHHLQVCAYPRGRGLIMELERFTNRDWGLFPTVELTGAWQSEGRVLPWDLKGAPAQLNLLRGADDVDEDAIARVLDMRLTFAGAVDAIVPLTSEATSSARASSRQSREGDRIRALEHQVQTLSDQLLMSVKECSELRQERDMLRDHIVKLSEGK